MATQPPFPATRRLMNAAILVMALLDLTFTIVAICRQPNPAKDDKPELADKSPGLISPQAPDFVESVGAAGAQPTDYPPSTLGSFNYGGDGGGPKMWSNWNELSKNLSYSYENPYHNP